jgi:death-on-curing protein
MSHGKEPCFLSFDQVMRLHRRSLQEHGGLDGVRDVGAVESALAAAQNTHVYGGGDLHEIAAAYAYHIAESQAFLDGNKRTAAGSAIAFLVLNGCIDGGDDAVIYDAMIAIAQRRMDKAGLAAVLRKQFSRT